MTSTQRTVHHTPANTPTPSSHPELNAALAQEALNTVRQGRDSIADRITPPGWFYPAIALLAIFSDLGYLIGSLYTTLSWNRFQTLQSEYIDKLEAADAAGTSTDSIAAIYDSPVSAARSQWNFAVATQFALWAVALASIAVLIMMIRWITRSRGLPDRGGLWPGGLTFGIRPRNAAMRALQITMYCGFAAYVAFTIWWCSTISPHAPEEIGRAALGLLLASCVWFVFFVATERSYDDLARKALLEI